MDQAQNRAQAALQPFLHLALTTKSSSPRILADLITRATSAHGTYIFAELLQTPAIQSLRSLDNPQEFRNYYALLEIFSYGTLADYQSTPNLAPLTPQQRHKLTLLTLLSVAGESEPLTYDYLISTLSLPSASAFESLITETIYNGLINARLSPTSTPPVVHITSVAPLRDLRPTSLPEILKVLQVWENRCRSVVGEIEGQIAGIRSHAVARKEEETRRQDIIDSAVLSTDASSEANTSAGVAGVFGRSTRSAWIKGVTSDEYKKGKGIGNKRDLDEQLEDEEFTPWGHHGGEEDGGVGVGLAKMEVDESAGVTGKGTYAGRTAKRTAGKKVP